MHSNVTKQSTQVSMQRNIMPTNVKERCRMNPGDQATAEDGVKRNNGATGGQAQSTAALA
jgi:hypothetical protein